MAKKITVTLDDVGERHLNELAYSLDLPHKKASQSDMVNAAMGECRAFEEITGDQITNYLLDKYPTQYKAWLQKNNIKQY
jgi:hypothetical protein